ncbi:MAG: arsenate reductase ArsC [FCB group bacterium]|nr:arsenate reductase ArsC [FCB group bacterium]
MTDRSRVLFVCTGNSCRSQMAEGWLRHLADDRYQVFSAGSHPSRVHPLAIQVMEEAGIDIRSHTSDFVDDYLDKKIDIVITVCDAAREVCPVFPGKAQRIHWSIDDPFTGWSANPADLPRYRKTRDELRTKIETWLHLC